METYEASAMATFMRGSFLDCSDPSSALNPLSPQQTAPASGLRPTPYPLPRPPTDPSPAPRSPPASRCTTSDHRQTTNSQ